MAAKKSGSYLDIIEEAKSGKISPLYLFYGDDEFYTDRLSAWFEENLLPPGERAFNQTIIYGRDASARQILETAARPPMMAVRQVLIVREAQDMKDKEYEGLESMFAKPWKHAVIVFCYKHGKPDMRRKVFKNLAANGVSFESPKLQEYQVEAWIKEYAREEGLKLEDDALMLLAENCGANRSMIHNELSKLRVHLTKSSEKISAAMIEEYIGISREYNIFEFTKAWGSRNVSKAFRIARYFSRNEKEMPLVSFNAQLYSYFQKVHLCLLFKRLGDAELAAQIGVQFYFVKEYRQAAQGLSSPKMGELFQLLAEYDARSKGMGQGGKSDGELLLELCFRMFHVCGMI